MSLSSDVGAAKLECTEFEKLNSCLSVLFWGYSTVFMGTVQVLIFWLHYNALY